MKNLKKGIICILIAITLLTCGAFADFIPIEEIDLSPIDIPYEYPILPGTSEWVKLGSTAARVAACQVPTDILSRMTTQALAETALEYPFNICIETLDNTTVGVQSLVSSSNVWEELISHPDAFEVLTALINSDSPFAEVAIHGAMQYMWENNLVTEEVLSPTYDFDNYSKIKIRDNNEWFSGLCETPAGTPVALWKPQYEWTTASQEERDEYYSNLFPESYLVGISCWRYNCFSYAFFDQSKNNQFRLTAIDAFFSDGSLREVSSPRIGDYIVYFDTEGNPIHIGVVESASSKLVIVRSKWGNGPLMDHASDEVPSEYGDDIVYYRET